MLKIYTMHVFVRTIGFDRRAPIEHDVMCKQQTKLILLLLSE